MYGGESQYDQSFPQKAVDYLSKGFTRTALAGELGVTRQTVYDWEKKYPLFKTALEVGDAKRQGTLEKEALALAKEGKGGSLFIFLLKNMTDMRDVSTFEHSGRDGKPIESSIDSKAVDALRQEYESKLKQTIIFKAPAVESVTKSTNDMEEED